MLVLRRGRNKLISACLMRTARVNVFQVHAASPIFCYCGPRDSAGKRIFFQAYRLCWAEREMRQAVKVVSKKGKNDSCQSVKEDAVKGAELVGKKLVRNLTLMRRRSEIVSHDSVS